jgi:hypothetical protein
MAAKKYELQTINFGKPGEQSRIIKDQLEKKLGKNKLSEVIRKLLVLHYSNEFENHAKKVELLNEYHNIKKQLAYLNKRKCQLQQEIISLKAFTKDELEEMGIE